MTCPCRRRDVPIPTYDWRVSATAETTSAHNQQVFCSFNQYSNRSQDEKTTPLNYIEIDLIDRLSVSTHYQRLANSMRRCQLGTRQSYTRKFRTMFYLKYVRRKGGPALLAACE